MARDRKRAKQRRDRQGRSVAPSSQPVRSDVPGALDHASSDVDEFDAAIVRAAEGMPVAEESLQAAFADAEQTRQTQRATTGDGGGVATVSGQRRTVAAPSAGGRAIAFLRASWAELQRVQWPDRRQVSQATAVVLGFVVIAGAYLGIADWVAQKIINFIL